MTLGLLRDRICDFCRTPKAIGSCPHIVRYGGQVTMSEQAFDRLQEDLWRLQQMESTVRAGGSVVRHGD